MLGGNMSETESPAGRPGAITAICVIGAIGAPFSVALVFSTAAREIGAWYPPTLALATLVGLACVVGLWKMKKWAAYTYTSFVAANQVLMAATGRWNIIGLLIPGLIVFFLWKHLDKMT